MSRQLLIFGVLALASCRQSELQETDNTTTARAESAKETAKVPDRVEATREARRAIQKLADRYGATEWEQHAYADGHSDIGRIFTIHIQDAIDRIQDKPVVMPLEVIDVFREGDRYMMLGHAAEGSYFLLRCPAEVGRQLSDLRLLERREPPFEIEEVVVAAVCKLNSLRTIYEREREADVVFEAEEDWQDSKAEVVEMSLYPRHAIFGECLAVDTLEGVAQAGDAARWWYELLERADFDEMKAYDLLESE